MILQWVKGLIRRMQNSGYRMLETRFVRLGQKPLLNTRPPYSLCPHYLKPIEPTQIGRKRKCTRISNSLPRITEQPKRSRRM